MSSQSRAASSEPPSDDGSSSYMTLPASLSLGCCQSDSLDTWARWRSVENQITLCTRCNVTMKNAPLVVDLLISIIIHLHIKNTFCMAINNKNISRKSIQKYFVYYNLSPSFPLLSFSHENRSLCTGLHPVGRHVHDFGTLRLHCWSPLDLQ